MSSTTGTITRVNSETMVGGYDRIISHACRELGLTKPQIAKRFGVHIRHIEPEHIKALWLEHLRKRR